MFAGIKRSLDGGKGLAGVSSKHAQYVNPVIDRMISELKEEN